MIFFAPRNAKALKCNIAASEGIKLASSPKCSYSTQKVRLDHLYSGSKVPNPARKLKNTIIIKVDTDCLIWFRLAGYSA